MKRKLSLISFTIMAIIILWSFWQEQKKDETFSINKDQAYIKSYMNHFTMTAINDTGQADYTIGGVRLEQMSNTDSAIVTMPIIRILREGQQWLITANTAIVTEKKNKIVLKKNVVMQQLEQLQPIRINSQLMRINTLTQIVSTNKPVHIHQGESEIHGIGMTYENKIGLLKLKEQVHGFFLPANEVPLK